MSRKSESKKSGTQEKTGPNIFLWAIAILVVIAAVLALTGNLPFITGGEQGKSFHLTGKETRPVLDPAMFTGKARAAYEAAQKYPEVLNEVYCYCYCDESPSKHLTLLSCFTDNHGAG